MYYHKRTSILLAPVPHNIGQGGSFLLLITDDYNIVPLMVQAQYMKHT